MNETPARCVPSALYWLERGSPPGRAVEAPVSLNPFVFARVAVDSPRPAERVTEALDQLLREGFEAGGRRYRLFGMRRGGILTMSLGLPLVGGAAPVLRARLREEHGPVHFDVHVTARIEIIVFGVFWLALTVLGGGYQLVLQVSEYLAGRATASDIWDVLPRIGVMAALIGLPLWYFRGRATRDAGLLLGAFRDAIGAARDGTAPSTDLG